MKLLPNNDQPENDLEDLEEAEDTLDLYEVHSDRTDPQDCVCEDILTVVQYIQNELESLADDLDLKRPITFVVREIHMTQAEFDELERRV